MPFNCPKCSEQIDAVSQNTLTERINAKNTEISGLKEALGESKTKAAGYDTLHSAHETLKGEHEALKTANVRSTSLGSVGVTDEKAVAGFEAIFASEKASNPDLDWATWMAADDGAKAHPLLSSHFTAPPPPGDSPPPGDPPPPPGGTPPPGAPPPGAPPAPGLPGSGTGDPAAPPAGATKMSAAQLQARFNSKEYRALPAKERKEEYASLKSQYDAQSG